RVHWGIDKFNRQTPRMLHLVDDLLDVSRITRDKIELRRTRVDLNEVIEEAVQSARPLMEKRNLELKVTLAAGPIWMNADATRLVQVFNNLLSNAAWYTESPGYVELTVTQSPG